MMDLEDGEVESSDNEEETQKRSKPPPPPPVNSLEFPDFPDDDEYVILDRPKSSILSRSTASAVAPSSSTSATVLPGNLLINPCGFGKPPAPSPAAARPPINPPPFQMEVSSSGSVEEYGKEAYYKNLGVSDLLESNSSDDKDSSGSDDSDSDCGAQFGKRSRMILPPRPPPGEMSSYASLFSSNPNASSAMASASSSAGSSQSVSSSGGLSMFQQQASQFQKQRKPNNIWSTVIQEEQISNIFETAKLDEVSLTNIEVEWGPETYRYHRPLREPRLRRESDSSEISSDGLSDNALNYLRGGQSYEEEHETEESSEHSLPKAFTGRITSRKATGTKRRISNPNHKKIKNKVLNKLRRLKSSELAEYMGTKLREEKVYLLGRAVDILGKDKCIHIFLKTLKIEKRGGLMIKNQERRRTPGGVFLYLIRGDPRFPKSLIDNIFRDERFCENKLRKKKVATTRIRRKAKLEVEKDQLEFAAINKRDDSHSDDTAVPWREQSGTDTGQLGDESSVQDKDTTDEFSGSADMQCDG